MLMEMVGTGELPKTEVTLMTARFPGRCSNCHRPFAKDDRIRYHRPRRLAFHAACPVIPTPAPRPDPIVPIGPRLMTAKFVGRCANCRETIEAGSPIQYAKPNAFHASCEPLVTADPRQTDLDLTALPYGTTRYSVMNESGVLTFLRVDHVAPERADGSRMAYGGNVYVKHQLGPSDTKRVGRQVLGDKYVGGFAKMLAAILEDPETAARRYGQELGRCSRCDLELTNALSRDLGIGPVCRKAFQLRLNPAHVASVSPGGQE